MCRQFIGLVRFTVGLVQEIASGALRAVFEDDDDWFVDDPLASP